MMFITQGFTRASAVVLFVVAALIGCASNPNANRDVVTESDESEASKRASIRLELAAGYFEQGQTKVALDEVKQALSAQPNNPEAYNLRALIYMRLNEPQLAEESFKRSLSLDAANPSVMHNYGWFLCGQSRASEATRLFNQALAVRNYAEAPKTHMALGMCQQKNGQLAEAERSYLHSYELDAGNPIVGYNLALILYQRGDYSKAQFYVRRINNSELANAQTLWLGLRTERKLSNQLAVRQLSEQLRKRFPSSEEAQRYERGQFDD